MMVIETKMHPQGVSLQYIKKIFLPDALAVGKVIVMRKRSVIKLNRSIRYCRKAIDFTSLPRSRVIDFSYELFSLSNFRYLASISGSLDAALGHPV